KPRPGLAQAWDFSADSRALTLKLRPGVRWHDGRDFTSHDVAFSALHLWKQFHSRGRMTYAHLAGVDTPDPLTAILRFDKPSPYVISALAANESQVAPRHLYEGRDVLSNPANIAPVGNGPFRFAEWQRGQFLRLERNPDYWDKGKPHVDGIILRILGDSAALSTALETGEIQFTPGVPNGDYQRLAKLPNLRADDRLFPLATSGTGIEFNLDVPKLQDVRVRQAVAHAIDKTFILHTILQGGGVIDKGPISQIYKDFYTDDVPEYPYDPAKAIALLDAAGLKPDASGVRLRFRLSPNSAGGNNDTAKVADYIRSALARVGIAVQVESLDFATFVRRVYTDRDWEVLVNSGQMGPDPVIGMQRWYWSKSFKRGVAFCNGSHYNSPAADHLLETAQVETDPARRRALYAAFSQLVMTDLPRIPLYTSSGGGRLVYSRQLSPLPDTAAGTFGSFADLSLSG
ncbi:MAG TPA: ABC transporter substrate-binding protein, partial [Novosphingobium sp.]|nr:ABC transporter substrate-binding protein [Novosphingobium sp.]